MCILASDMTRLNKRHRPDRLGGNEKPRRNRSVRSDDAGAHMAKVNEGDPATYDCLVRTTRHSTVEGRGQQLPSNYSDWRCAYGQAFRDEVRLRAGIHAIPVRPD